jgi:hypothetical protein
LNYKFTLGLPVPEYKINNTRFFAGRQCSRRIGFGIPFVWKELISRREAIAMVAESEPNECS